MYSHEQRLNAYAVAVNDALHTLTDPLNGGAAVPEAIRYSLLDGGKRLRAALVLELSRISGSAAPEKIAPSAGAIRLACAVEMIHAYSLIHDDLPCMDNDDFRRGKPSCHRKFGYAQALLAGDALLTLAFEVIADAPLTDRQRTQAALVLARAAGVNGMVGGQALDLAGEGHVLSEQELRELYALKTGALLRVSAAMGCIAADASPEKCEAADAFARAYGLAFQITDDLLDVAGDAEKTGKPVGSDQANEKTTFVAIFGEAGAHRQAEEELDAACEAAKSLGDGAFLIWLARSLADREK